MRKITHILVFACLIVAVQTAFGQGILVNTTNSSTNREPVFRPFSIKHIKATVKIHDAVAETTIEQVFRNETTVQQEAVYVFPIPENASVTSMTLRVGDKIAVAKVLKKEEARAVYENIVRQMKDPALLEFIGRDIVKLSVFPIPPKGEQTITLRYAELLKQESGNLRYLYPLRPALLSRQPIENISISGDIATSSALTSVFSPSHADASVKIKSSKLGSFAWSSEDGFPDRDLVIYFKAGKDDVGLSLLTYKQGGDGYFMLFVSPGLKSKEADIPKRMVFAFDRTGSMSGEKIVQAKEALKYTLEHLRPIDKFNVVTFNEEPQAFTEKMVSATPENIKKAVDAVMKLDARGGTNILSALKTSLELLKDETPETLNAVLFMTDGQPTVGETDVNRILAQVKDANKNKIRFFTWGVGEDVNVPFLDKIAIQNYGETDYVRAGESLEIKLTAYFDKISSPVLTDLKLLLNGVHASEIYPKELPDLFASNPLVIVGRYSGSGAGAVLLEGLAKNKPKTLKLAANFPEEADLDDYIPRIWATRKIGALIDSLRLKNNQEVINEIIRLSKEYGIVTEYTSFLITEEQLTNIARGSFDVEQASAEISKDAYELRETGDTAMAKSRVSSNLQNAPAAAAPGGQQSQNYGRMGARAGDKKDEWSASNQRNVVQVVQYAADRTFYYDGKQWTDSRNDAGLKHMKIQRNSQAHFALIRKVPKLAKYTAVGEAVLVVINNQAVLFSDEGKETLTDKELSEILKRKS